MKEGREREGKREEEKGESGERMVKGGEKRIRRKKKGRVR